MIPTLAHCELLTEARNVSILANCIKNFNDRKRKDPSLEGAIINMSTVWYQSQSGTKQKLLTNDRLLTSEE